MIDPPIAATIMVEYHDRFSSSDHCKKSGLAPKVEYHDRFSSSDHCKKSGLAPKVEYHDSYTSLTDL